jgi:hypothetical protein
VLCVFGALEQVSDDEAPFPFLHVPPPPRPSARAAAASLADSDDEVPMLRFSHRPALISCFGDAAVLPLCPGLFCLCPSTPPFLSVS